LLSVCGGVAGLFFALIGVKALGATRIPIAQMKIINQDLLTRINNLPGVKITVYTLLNV
jgi:hypothetical protein